MESLALVVSVIVIAIAVVGVAARGVAWKNPERAMGRVAGSVVGVLALAAGGWLALLEVGRGGRLFGATVAVLGVIALVRSIRRG
ncbi:MAG: hypothetical protein ACO3AV_01475 [Ilumatobacteraceae bacterium]